MHEHTGLWVHHPWVLGRGGCQCITRGDKDTMGYWYIGVSTHHPRARSRPWTHSPGGVCAHPPWVRARAGCPCLCRGCVIHGGRAPLGRCAIRAVLGALSLLAVARYVQARGGGSPARARPAAGQAGVLVGCCPPGEVSQAVLAEFTARGSTLSSAWHGWAGCRVGAGDALPVPPISREHCSVAVRLG